MFCEEIRHDEVGFLLWYNRLVDDLSSEMFGNPTVQIGGYQGHTKEIRQACRAIFGRALTPLDFAELIAAPDQSELLITVDQGDHDIKLRVGHHWFNGTQNYLIYREADSGKRVVEFDRIALRDDAPELLETRLFARQVRSFRRFGMDEVRLFAEGYAGHPGGIGGYYVWARLGFVMELSGYGAALAAAGFADVETTLDLFSRPDGDRWWLNHGSERPAVFYLNNGSPCLLALQGYLAGKGISVDA